VAREGILIRKVGGGGHNLIPLDSPSPTIMADGIGGVCRRGWQYAIVGGYTLLPPDIVPREGGAVDSEAELRAIRDHEAHLDRAGSRP
jgi:hypothetical protein